jgi:hypothetical protein
MGISLDYVLWPADFAVNCGRWQAEAEADGKEHIYAELDLFFGPWRPHAANPAR